MQSKRGFTIIEIVVAILIVAVISGYAASSFNKYISSNQLEKASFDLFNELSSIRPTALKNDCKVLVKFSAAGCSVFVDKNGDAVIQKEEFLEVWNATGNVVLGLPSQNPPSSAPAGAQLPETGKAASGEWKNYMMVNNDALGRVNSGTVYLSSKKLKKITYGILSVNSQNLKIYSWDGSKWKDL